MESLSHDFVGYVAESISQPPELLWSFIGKMSRLKLVKYPPAQPGSQGVGPHKDSIGLFTFLAQDNIGGLQVLNKSGEWIDAPPIEGSLIVNIAQGFEAITGGVCSGTTHRVVVSLFPKCIAMYWLSLLISDRRPRLQLATVFPTSKL